MFNVGDYVRIDYMVGEDVSRFPMYGIVEYVDDAGQAHGNWGGLALQDTDAYEIIPKGRVFNFNQFSKWIDDAMEEEGLSEDEVIEWVEDYIDKNNLLQVELFDKEMQRKLNERVQNAFKWIMGDEECTDSE